MTASPSALAAERLRARLVDRSATIAVIGLGYVGLPLVLAIHAAGFRTLGVDIDAAKVAQLSTGKSYLNTVPASAIEGLNRTGRFVATADFGRLGEADAILIAVPTPLDRHREPDLGYVVRTAEQIAATLRPEQLVILESTTYPGTTRDAVKPILEAGGLASGRDFWLAYSPEREDPGNADFTTTRIPKVIGGDGAEATGLAETLYAQFVERTVVVSSAETAEAVKLTENIFRAVNIALVNELKLVYGAMGIDIWEVIEAAKTKPFGFMPFYPGPGLGGHCIPIDPFYLTWKAREFDIATRFIELAGEINRAMPRHVIDALAAALDSRTGRGLKGARILILGIAYKKNVDDTRESPALALWDLLRARGAEVAYHDPLVPVVPRTREHGALAGVKSSGLTPELLSSVDAVLIATDHEGVDYGLLRDRAALVVDTRNAMAGRGFGGPDIVKA
jgi:UDP-N-acetyl-D-glucosamine dehydrogenase